MLWSKSFHFFSYPKLPALSKAAYDMQTAVFSKPFKRQRSNQHPSKLEEEARPVSKKRKTIHKVLPEQQTVYRDNIPRKAPTLQTTDALRQPNVKKALTEQEASKNQQLHRPINRPALAKWRKRHLPQTSADSFLKSCGRDLISKIKRFIKHGGPDLRNLINIGILNGSLTLVLTLLICLSLDRQPDESKPGQCFK